VLFVLQTWGSHNGLQILYTNHTRTRAARFSIHLVTSFTNFIGLFTSGMQEPALIIRLMVLVSCQSDITWRRRMLPICPSARLQSPEHVHSVRAAVRVVRCRRSWSTCGP